MRRKIESLAMACMLAFGSFLFMVSLMSQNVEAALTWSIETVDSAGYVGEWTSIALDSNNRPHISYYDGTNTLGYAETSNLNYAYWDGSSWQTETVDSTGIVGDYSSIVLDSNNRPHISYYDLTNNDLKYAKAVSSAVSDVPTGLTATPGDGQVTVSWNSVSGAAGYNVYVSTTSGSGFAQVNTALVTGTTYIVTGLTNSITYYFYVTSVIDSGESSASSEVSATPTAEEDGEPNGGGGGGCFIATAAYGSPMAKEVVVLRDFRDNVFLQTSAGRCFVKFYYEISPPLAVYIRHHDILRTATRLTLTPVVYGVKYPKTSALIFLSSILAISLTLGVRRSNRF